MQTHPTPTPPLAAKRVVAIGVHVQPASRRLCDRALAEFRAGLGAAAAANGRDQLDFEITTVDGKTRRLILEVDQPSVFIVRTRDHAIAHAYVAIDRHTRGLAAEIANIYGLRFDREGESLYADTTHWADVADLVWRALQGCLAILAAADWLPSTPASTRTDCSMAQALTASLEARALVVAGELLGACERQVPEDVGPAWHRLRRAIGLAPQLAAAENLPDVKFGMKSRTAYEITARVVSAALRNADAIDALRHWRDVEAAVRALCETERRYHQANANAARDADPDTDHPWPDVERAERLVRHEGQAAYFTPFALGQEVQR